MVIAPQFDQAGQFVEGRAAVRRNALWGFINTVGRMVVPPQFAFAKGFSDGLAYVRWPDTTNSAYIDTDGNVVIVCADGDPDVRLTFRRCGGSFAGGFVSEAVEIFRCVDESGRQTGGEYPCRANFIDRWGFYDKAGQMAIAGPFGAGAGPFAEGLAAVRPYGSQRAGYIDASGAFAIPAQFDQAHAFSEGLAAARMGLAWGFIDRSGQFVIRPQYQSAQSFSGGYAAIRVDGKWGYVDRMGRQIIAPRFSEAGPFSEGVAAVCCDEGSRRYIDVTGAGAFERRLAGGGGPYAGSFSGGVALVDLPGGVAAYINRRGAVIAPLRVD
jgi:hypothetical protein